MQRKWKKKLIFFWNRITKQVLPDSYYASVHGRGRGRGMLLWEVHGAQG